jgi:hypothetical protein
MVSTMFKEHEFSRKASLCLTLALVIFLATPSRANADELWSGKALEVAHGGVSQADFLLTKAASNYKKELTAAFKANPKSVALIKAVVAAHKTAADRQNARARYDFALTNAKAALATATKELADAKAAAEQAGVGRDPSGAQQPSVTLTTPDVDAAEQKLTESKNLEAAAQKNYAEAVTKLKAAQVDLSRKVTAAKKDPLIATVSKYAKKIRYLEPKDYLPDFLAFKSGPGDVVVQDSVFEWFELLG